MLQTHFINECRLSVIEWLMLDLGWIRAVIVATIHIFYCYRNANHTWNGKQWRFCCQPHTQIPTKKSNRIDDFILIKFNFGCIHEKQSNINYGTLNLFWCQQLSNVCKPPLAFGSEKKSVYLYVCGKNRSPITNKMKSFLCDN